MSSWGPHTACRRGKRVRVVLRNGVEFIAKFHERKGKFVWFEDRKVLRGDIKSFMIVKGCG